MESDLSTNFLTLEGTASDDFVAGSFRARLAGGVEPSIGAAVESSGIGIPELAVAATTGYVVYRVLEPTLGTYIARKIFGYSGASGSDFSGSTTYFWAYQTSGSVGSVSFSTGSTPGPGWHLRYHDTANRDEYCIPAGSGFPSAASDRVMAAAATHSYSDGNTGRCGSSAFVAYRTSAEYNQHIRASHIADPGAGSGVITASSSAGTTCNITCLENALAGVGAASESSQDPPDAAVVSKLRADAGLDTIVAPDCIGATVSVCSGLLSTAGSSGSVVPTVTDFNGADVTHPADTIIEQPVTSGSAWGASSDFDVTVNPADTEMPFNLFRPLVGETYAEYVARLQAAGWLGAATEIDLNDDTGDPAWGPNGVPKVGVKIGTSTTKTILAPSLWPNPVPKIKAGTDIDVYKNPGDYSPVPPEENPTDPDNPGDPPGVAIPPTGNCGPTVPSVDFSPITGVDFGNKFPFGIFSYIASALSPLVASPSAPVFDVPIYLMGDSFSLHVDFSPADPYMATVRLLMEIGIGITAVWLLAGSLLGFKAGNAGGGLDMDTSMGDD